MTEETHPDKHAPLRGWLRGDEGSDSLKTWLEGMFPQDMQKEVMAALSEDEREETGEENKYFDVLKKEYLNDDE